MTTTTKSLSLPDQFKDAMSLVARVNALTIIKTKDEYAVAESDYRTLIANEKNLKLQFDDLDIVKDYNKVYEQYQSMKSEFAKSKKYVKDIPMRKFDDAQEAERQAKERAMQAEAQRLADIETAKQVEIQRQKFLKSESARKIAEDEQKKAEAAIRAAQKKGDEAAAKAAAERAAAAEVVAQAEREKQEAARAEAEAIKAEAVAPTVVLEKTHTGVTRRKVYRYRLTTKDGRKYLKNELTASTRLQISDLGPLPAHLFVLSPVLLNDYVDSMGEAAAIPRVLEVKGEMV